MNKKVLQLMEKLPQILLLQGEPLSKYSNTRTGGPADLLAFPANSQQAIELVGQANKLQLPITILGNASNLIVKDGGIEGLVIILRNMKQINCQTNKITAEAGASLIDVTEMAYQRGLTGLEFAAGIPGSVGGAIFMNAGAYGGEISQVVESVTVIDRQGQLKKYSKRDLNFNYRHSRIQTEGDLVLEATFNLESGNQQLIHEKMNDLNFRRAAKQPLEYPSCGSVFKRPQGHYTGKLIQDAGLQGFRVGDAQISLKHAGFIVNLGQATAGDYLTVIQHVQQTILKKFQVKLETEVRIIGRDA
ncbi:MAG: UDP-N-acetylmuramate dehydrogenase [Liquorilactobacillus nagelii]|mgnify:CR=1 FL=1|jgi:UDP-N-acetylmuramate dehydrogenase|uniref:UDP-N-acetylmuramate dehydrogenase n=1 Tax=Liquorilactobacillus nagelii TaxID=82688 RepID=UPI00242F6EAE|nr:UDP-N-acetylmuramate dehydrogenase [Liquorilactobacillus nagelii]MCI1634324.1 UDP-N-acetylmuramate dehydrogenase [Liquorilactobacillus nagelii]MCI1922274.1 UDP-N-acetylmuramate dehydrogenase [Liquorilactobacillus nagelii]MCI1977401.1 UDP-N-acetylmuramate dehydrogenase [Liquorilactobacillus nagelii]